jgi:replication initiation and membrane attachment protein DnaB
VKYDGQNLFKYFVINISNSEKWLQKRQLSTSYIYRIAGSIARCAVTYTYEIFREKFPPKELPKYREEVCKKTGYVFYSV